MSTQDEANLHLRIESIISRSRMAEEQFLIDTKRAASEIIEHLHSKKLIVTEASVFEIKSAAVA